MFKNLIKMPILKRLIPSLYKKYLFATNNYNHQIIFNKIIYDLDLRHLIDRRFFFHRGYEDELFVPLSQIIKNFEADIFFDIGSCWGLYSLRLASMNKKLKILSFDPIKNNICRLKSSVYKNNISNIKIYHTAIGNKKGIVELGATEKYSPNYEINLSSPVVKEKSNIDFLDNMFEIQNKFLVFKIDTEGFEYEVLTGATKLLQNNKCFIQVEIKNDNFSNVVNLLNFLKFNKVSINVKNKTDFFFSNVDIKEIKI